jgi:hypothetical protein
LATVASKMVGLSVGAISTVETRNRTVH